MSDTDAEYSSATHVGGVSRQAGGVSNDSSDGGVILQNVVSHQDGISCQGGGVSHSSDGGDTSDGGIIRQNGVSHQ